MVYGPWPMVHGRFRVKNTHDPACYQLHHFPSKLQFSRKILSAQIMWINLFLALETFAFSG
jgi:hypothetical protein